MSGPPTSVLLPTVEWTSACEEVAAQLGPDDELLVICDSPADPVAGRDVPAGVRVVVAGDPEGCSGKANAIAAGMEAARNDRFVWTDDDFRHPSDWLEQFHADYADHGPVSEVPVYVGQDPLSVLLEPSYVSGGSLGTHLGDKAWGGAVMFDREDLDVAAFLDDLRRTVSDDALLSEYLDVTSLSRTRRVPVGGTVRETLERHVRFMQIVFRHEPRQMAATVAVTVAVWIGCVLAPLPAAVLVTILHAGSYAALGVRRWTAVLAYPSTLAMVPLVGYALARRTFVWGGRRYHWPAKFDVTVRPGANRR